MHTSPKTWSKSWKHPHHCWKTDYHTLNVNAAELSNNSIHPH